MEGFRIYNKDGLVMLTIAADGLVTLGAGVTNNEAAEAFWREVVKLNPLAHTGDAQNDRVDANRYRWLRDGNSYAPEENFVRGGPDLDRLCDDGIAGRDLLRYVDTPPGKE